MDVDVVQAWAAKRLGERCNHGSMVLEEFAPETSIGVSTRVDEYKIVCQVQFSDPWSVTFYGMPDSKILKQWFPWQPKTQLVAAI